MSRLLDETLCCQRVTLYQKRGQTVRRTVVDNACLFCEASLAQSLPGDRRRVSFSLILPGEELSLYPGDRVFHGEGPVCEDWNSFIPAAVPGLMQIEYVSPCYWEGTFSHWEAGA